jgi:hypothetical protein
MHILFSHSLADFSARHLHTIAPIGSSSVKVGAVPSDCGTKDKACAHEQWLYKSSQLIVDVGNPYMLVIGLRMPDHSINLFRLYQRQQN